MEILTHVSDFGEVRTMEENGEILFCASDVAKALGYSNPNKAVIDHCKKDGVTNREVIDSLGRTQEAKFIREPDLYRLVAKSKLPQAEKFETWIFEEVLPSIRQHGMYATPTKVEDILSDPDNFIALLQNYKAVKDKNTVLEQANSDLTVKNTIMAPKSDYFDELVDRNLLTNFRETAKELDVKEKVFIQFLLDKKYIFRDKKGKIRPFAGKGDGLFATKECYNDKTKWSGTQTLITPKGRETFRLLMKGA